MRTSAELSDAWFAQDLTERAARAHFEGSELMEWTGWSSTSFEYARSLIIYSVDRAGYRIVAVVRASGSK